MPSCAALTAFGEQALSNSEAGNVMSDNAIKCGIRNFDIRVFQGCAIIDSEVRRQAPSASGHQASAPTPLVATILQKCTRDPIQLSEISKRVARLQGCGKYQQRVAALREMQALGLGEVKETRRRPGEVDKEIELYRFPLTAEVQKVLTSLGVSAAFWVPCGRSSKHHK